MVNNSHRSALWCVFTLMPDAIKNKHLGESVSSVCCW